MEWQYWQNTSLTERDRLPSDSGIYVVADTQNFVWYVGQAKDLRNRWTGKNHHRYPQLIRTHRKLGYKIYWRLFSVDQLNEKEQLYIQLFNPELNGGKVKTYLPKQPQVEREIKRLLKALNRRTFLFPIIRSVVAGEYNDENGVQCILIIVNLNDCRLLESSARKKRATKVRESWIDFKSSCGRNKDYFNDYWVPAYRIFEKRFEFIPEPEIIRHLEDPILYEQCIGASDLFGVQVRVLRNLSFLDSLPLEEEYNLMRNGKRVLKGSAYINYRKPILMPIPNAISVEYPQVNPALILS